MIGTAAFGPGDAFLQRWLGDRIPVVQVPLTLAQQKKILVRLCAPVAHAFRHRIRLVPNDVLTEVPAVGAEREGDSPWYAHQVFWLDLTCGRIIASAPAALAARKSFALANDLF